MKKLTHRFDLAYHYMIGLICDCFLCVLDKKKTFDQLRFQTLETYYVLKRTYRIVEAVDVIRGLTPDEMVDVMNSVLPKEVIDFAKEDLQHG